MPMSPGASSPLRGSLDASDRGSINPFVPGAKRHVKNRDYTLRIANLEATASSADREPNTMYAGTGVQIQVGLALARGSGRLGAVQGNGKRGVSDSLNGVDPRGPDGLGEGCEVALVLRAVAL
jgi:hypothetical protein